MQRLDYASDGFLFIHLVALQVSHVGTAEHTFHEQTVHLLHAAGQLVTELLLKACERADSALGQSPQAQLFQGANIVPHWVI